jgi:hypothetical protein
LAVYALALAATKETTAVSRSTTAKREATVLVALSVCSLALVPTIALALLVLLATVALETVPLVAAKLPTLASTDGLIVIRRRIATRNLLPHSSHAIVLPAIVVMVTVSRTDAFPSILATILSSQTTATMSQNAFGLVPISSSADALQTTLATESARMVATRPALRPVLPLRYAPALRHPPLVLAVVSGRSALLARILAYPQWCHVTLVCLATSLCHDLLR